MIVIKQINIINIISNTNNSISIIIVIITSSNMHVLRCKHVPHIRQLLKYIVGPMLTYSITFRTNNVIVSVELYSVMCIMYAHCLTLPCSLGIQ